MPKQLDMLGHAGLEIEPDATRSEPRLWVRRLVVWSEPGTVLREIRLRPGLDIIWAPDSAALANVPDGDSTVGHGSGKTLFLSIEGNTHLPAFLIHDSPREADLGLNIYQRLFRLAGSLESAGSRPMFQYIITTTTSPPDEMRMKPWLSETLGGAANERLMNRDL